MIRVNATTGAVFGVVLAILGMMAAGAGHGTYVLLGASSAPAGIGGVLPAIIGTPVLWAVVGWLTASGDRGQATAAAIVLVHYASAAWLLTRSPWGDFAYLGDAMTAFFWGVIAWCVIYAAGQRFVWRAILYPARPNQPLQPTSGAQTRASSKES
jgi:hypothetical protein